MSFESEYLKLRKKRLEEEANKKKNTTTSNSFDTDEYLKLREQRLANEKKTTTKKTTSNDIAPVKEEKKSWFKSGLFEDGYDFGDITRTILGTTADISAGIVQGGANLVEGITDLGLYGVSGLSSLVGADDFAEDVKGLAKENSVNTMFDSFRGNLGIEEASVLGERSYGVAQGLGQIGSIILTGGAASSALGATALTTGAMGLSSWGSGMSEAYQSGASDEDAVNYGIMKGVVDAGSELIFGGLGKGVKALGISRGLSSLDDAFAKKLSSKISNRVLSNLTEYGVKASAEGVEEVLAGYGSAVAKKLTYMSDEDLQKLVENEELLDQFIMGAVTSGIAQSGIVPKMNSGSLIDTTKRDVDFVTGMSKYDEQVANKITEDIIAEKEAKGEKLSKKDKNDIYDDVIEKMERGDIETETIEEMLGGDTYKSYKDTVDNEEALKKELAELRQMKNGERNDIQNDRLAELKAMNLDDTTKRDGLKSQLSDEVFSLVKDGKLVESYKERAKRSQAFTANLEEYDEKYRAAVQKAMDSGVWNNSRKSHEAIDFLARISVDKGVDFDYLTNEKIAKTSFGVEGKIVNGYRDGNKIGINIQSPKYLNTIVGHELTHILEGTDLYNEFSKTIITYAKNIGDYKGRYDSLSKLYKGVKGYEKNFNAKVEKEIVADLVGDYIFTDSKFLARLSTENKNVFQKLYDEIKYLCRVATAGSKEAKELERVKREFEKVYRGEVKTDTKKKQYSLSEAQEEYFKDSQVRDENGNLKVMYHGTSNGGHTVFDTFGESKFGLFGAGTYFTDNKEIAESYTEKGRGNNKQVYESYLNITNPIDMDAKADVEAWKKAFPDADYTDCTTNEDCFRAMKEVFVDEQYPQWEAKDTAMDVLEGMGYDGITHIGGGRVNADGVKHRVYIAFNPEQIKNIDNTKPTSNPDIRYSLSIDSQGRELTTGQQKYFKDSKIVDKNGNLKVMYHGSRESFTEFDRKKARSGGTYGNGFYFTDSDSHAKTYGEAYEVYLNITNPLQSGTRNITKEQLRKFVEVIAENEDYGIDNYGYGATIDSVVDSVYGKDDFAMLMDINISCVGNMVEAIELFNETNGTDYNGIIAPTETVAFYPNQIKVVDNKTPTSDSDIRYSLSDSEGNKLTEKQAEHFKDSKMRDDNGNLVVMYHGSQDAGFHEFEQLFSDDNTSFFFVDNPKVAKSYSGTDETYTAKTFRTAEDFNKFFAEIGMDEYEVKYENGWFDLYEDGESVAQAETAKMLYDEFRDWTGLGTGSANYKVYLNLKNPLIVDAKGRSWDRISSEFSQEIYDRFQTLTEAEKQTLKQVASWDDIGIFRDEIMGAKAGTEAYSNNLASAYEKLGGEDVDMYRLFDIVTDNFSEESLRENAVAYLNTREYAQRAKYGGYDGVIFKNIVDNGAYASGMDRFASSTVAIAFESNQIKSVANENPTNHSDIRYSLSDGKNSLDKYTQKQYNNFGWARVNDALSKNELDDMYSKIHVKGSLAKFKKSSRGESIIEVNDNPHTTLGANNVFAFVKGSKNEPQITRVVRVNLFDEDSIEIFRKDIYERNDHRTLEAYARVMGEKFIQYYDRNNSASFGEYSERARTQQSGTESQRDTFANRSGDQRNGTFEETQSDEIAPIKETASTDGVFFDAKKTAYSLSEKADIKQRQLEIINETNPAYSDSFTWIRKVEDIHTLEETLALSDWADYDEFDPDLTKADILNAIKSGKITVYSSHPIENGAFVTPSLMEAKSYAGDGKVYQKRVDIRNVAWIDPTQGQYAEVNASDPDIRYSLSDGDDYSRIQQMQLELNETRNKIADIEKSDDFKSQMDKLTQAIGSDDVENGIKEYNQWQEISGYGELINRKSSLQTELENLKKEYSEKLTNAEVEKEKNAIEKSGLSEADYFRKQAVKEFGYTPYFYDAGYITPNGKMLNFSGEKADILVAGDKIIERLE